MAEGVLVGLDIGSTTVKAVAMDAANHRLLWQDYRRHETQQGRTTVEFLRRIWVDLGLSRIATRLFFTGSGASGMAPHAGGRFVQEVNAVTLAIESRHPDVCSAVELGGQDAKILFFEQPHAGGERRQSASMNDKCAGGTGAFIDKLSAKLAIPRDRLCRQRYRGYALHQIAGKCGVFAETDINGLLKQGVPAEELMASLFDAIVVQNLTVLTRGRVLCPKVLLLGGPNTFLPGLREAWQEHIPRMWRDRGVPVPGDSRVSDLIFAPELAEYYGALGAVEFGFEVAHETPPANGPEALERWLETRTSDPAARPGIAGLRGSSTDLKAFLDRYDQPAWTPPRRSGTVRVFLGIDGGSTSTKAALVDEQGDVIAEAYRLSNGNPILDAIEISGQLERDLAARGCTAEILGAATTGYAKHVLGCVLHTDVELVETVAHARSGLAVRPDIDVIVDVGGQDIKLIVIQDGTVRDFMLNTQCSAGNGYFLQATARSFGVSTADYATHAFNADRMPEFSYGCAVFLQADIVNFQRQGWTADAILAGLAAVLPKNIWLYVANVANPARLGRRFLLQGGTQRNLAVVKAQVDYLESRIRGFGLEPEILVHPHCGEAGAIGAAMEAARLYRDGHRTSFPGLAELRHLKIHSVTGEPTRCSHCSNHCLRTFIDWQVAGREGRFIAASCEKGAARDDQELIAAKAHARAIREANPDLVRLAARTVVQGQHPALVADPPSLLALMPGSRARNDRRRQRESVHIGIPRVLNQYLYGPFFSGYLESLGVPAANLIWSGVTTGTLYREGAGRGAIDPCYPSKVVVAHLQSLLDRRQGQPLDAIFVPQFDTLETPFTTCVGSNACPTASATPLAAGAAFRVDGDLFQERNIAYLHPLLNLRDRPLLERQMLDAWTPLLGLTPDENARAIDAGWTCWHRWLNELHEKAWEVLLRLEQEERLAIVMLGRPYHHDPGLNHGLFEEFQKLGYPILSQTSLPTDPVTLAHVFGDSHPLDIDDVWKHSYSASTSQKVWAAKFVARHPNLVGIEISNFKCGHDAPAQPIVRSILEQAGKPYFCFGDVDENKPAASMRIRVETIHYYLQANRERLLAGARVSSPSPDNSR